MSGRDDADLQAKVARSLAPSLCRTGGCGWYHGVWPALRGLGLVATPYRHEAFFDDALGAVAARGGRRVLVSGAADAAMAAIVHGAFADRGVTASLTVVDRCATPVRVVEDWGARHGVDVVGLVGDVLADHVELGHHDAVCTHGLLSIVDRQHRAHLAARWAAALAPGGVVATTVSLSSSDAPDPTGFDAAALEQFAEQARQVGAPDELVDGARQWASRVQVHPVRSKDEVVEVLAGAGFDVDVEVRDVGGDVAASAAGPTAARSGRYLEIVATRR